MKTKKILFAAFLFGAMVFAQKTARATTSLFPNYTLVTSTKVGVSWTPLVGSTFTVALSTDSSFTFISASVTVPSNTYFSNSPLMPGTTYHFRVKVSSESDSSYSVNTVSTKTLALVTSLFPTAVNVSSQSLGFSWLPGPAPYTLAISTDNSFNVWITSITVGTTAYTTSPTLTPDTTYFFRVKVAGESDSSYFVNSISTRTLPPPPAGTSLSPSVIAVSSNALTFSWLAAASFYDLILSTDSSFAVWTTSITIETTDYTTGPNLIPNATYFFKVKVASEPFSSFALNLISTQTRPGIPLSNLSPSIIGISSNSLNFSWQPAASPYLIVLSTMSSFSVSIASFTVGTTSYATGPTLNPNTTYYFQVKVAAEPDSSFALNSISTKTLAAVPASLLSPTIVGVSSNSLTFNWTPATSPYAITLSTTSSFSVWITSITVGTTEYTTGPTLIPNTLYFFQVKVASEPDSSYGQNTISTKTLFASNLTSLVPQFTNINSTSVTVSWNHVGASSYTVALSTTNTFLTLKATGTFSSSIYTSTVTLTPLTTYYFRVKVSSEPDSAYALNLISTKTLSVIASTGTFLNPQVTAVSTSSLQISWNSIIGSTYTIALSTKNTFTTITTSMSVTSNIFSPTGLLSGTTYYFKVKISTELDSAYSSVSTRTMAGSAPITFLNPYFTFVGLDLINVAWTAVPGANYVAVLSTASDFSKVQYDEVINTANRNYPPGLFQDTTYYFRVKLSSETNASFSPVISTKTMTPGAGGNSALSFSNQVAIVSSNTAIDLQSNITIEFWFRRTAFSGNMETMVAKDNYGKSAGWMITLLPAGQMRYDALSLGGIQTLTYVTNSNWHHFAMTRDSAGTTKIYLDGVLENSGYTPAPGTNGQGLKFGNAENLASGFSGILDEIRIWNQARTQSVIQSSRSFQASPNDSSLIGNWDFNEGVGQLAQNKSPLGNALNAQLGNSLSTEGIDATWTVDPIPGFGAPMDSTPPTISVLSPAQGSTQTINTMTVISGTAQDDSVVQNVSIQVKRLNDGYFLNAPGIYWTATPYSNLATGTTNWMINTANVFWSTGTYEITLQAQDANFNVTIGTVNFAIGVPVDSVRPTIAINYPVQNSTYTGNQLLNFSGSASDDVGLSKVRLRVIRLSDSRQWDNMNVVWTTGTVFNETFGGLSSWQFTLPISAWTSSGTYTVIARSEDFSNNFATAAVSFNLQVGTTSANDVIPPLVNVTHPSSGTTHSPSALTSLYGNASDDTSVVEIAIKIQDLSTGLFWNGSSFSAAVDTWFFLANPTSWNFGGIPTGAWTNNHGYAITARAKDASNNFGFNTSNFFVVTASTADTIPPTVTINGPSDGGTYAPNGLNFYGTAGDNVGLLTVEWNLKRTDTGLSYDGVGFVSPATNTFLTATGLSGWSFVVPPVAFANANYQLEVRAKDTSNNYFSRIIGFTVTGATGTSDVIAPSIVISTPIANNIYTNPTLITQLAGTSADNVSVTEVVFSLKDDANKFWDGNAWSAPTEFWLGTTFPTTSWQAYVPFLAWKSGTFQMRARARDNANNVSYATITFSVSGATATGNADSLPPLTYIYNPTNNSNQGPYAFTYLNGRSEDSFGVSEVAISLRNVSLGLYWNGAGFNSTTEWFLNPSIGLTEANAKEWSFSISNTAYTNGNYVLRVRAKDPSGNTSIVSSSFTVSGAGSGAGDFTPPQIFISSPADSQTYNASQLTEIFGTSFDNISVNTVEIRVTKQGTGERWNGNSWVMGDIWLGVPLPVLSWKFFAPISMWSDGAYSISARARDAANNEIIQTNNFTMSGAGSGATPPTVSVALPLSNQTYSPASIVVNGSATDTVAVSSVQIRITDLNLNLDWNPDLNLWTAGDRWFYANVSGSFWSTTRLPLWPAGRFRVTAQAINSSRLFSTAQQRDFYVNVSSTAVDVTAPAAISTLAAKTGSVDGSVILTWTAPGNDGNTGTASGYIIKYLPGSPITETNWYSAFDITMPPLNQSLPVPLVAGVVQTSTITNLSPGLSYFWAMRALDAAGNRSGISNSPIATAFGGCVAGVGDGEGSVTVSPSSLAESTTTRLNLTFSVGTSGITKGGRLKFKVPDGWMYPQVNYPGMTGYITYATSNGLVTFSAETAGPVVTLTVQSGTLNANDTVTLTYLAMPSCGLQTNLKLNVLSQASSCGVPAEISAQPSVTIVAGPASRIGFDSYEKLVPVNQIVSMTLQGQSNCGGVATLANSVSVNAAALLSDINTGMFAQDPSAVLSLSSDLSAPFTSSTFTFPGGQSSKTIYYKLTSSANSGRNYVRLRYIDLQYGSYTSENMLRTVSVSQAGFTNVSADSGQPGTAAQTTITPNGDGVADSAFINFNSGSSNLSWNVKISKDNFATIAAEFWGSGNPTRVAWDGRRTYPYNDLAPAGTYQVKISAGGQTDTSLSIIVQTNDITGTVKSSVGNTPVPYAYVNIFGAFNRFTQTDSSGSFTVGGLPAGTYTIQVDKPGYVALRNSISVTGSGQNLGNILISPQAKLVFVATRTETTNEIWGVIRASDSAREIRGSAHFAIGKNTADDGFSTNAPELYLATGTFTLSADLPGASVAPVQHTFTDGEVYYWNVSLTGKKKISGQIRLANGISNTTGFNVSLSAGLDNNLDGRFDLGYPNFFANGFIPISENQTFYSFPGMDAGTYRIMLYAPGLTPEVSTVTLASADVTQDFVLKQTGQALVNLQFTGDTTSLDTVAGDPTDGQFPVTVRFVSTTTVSTSKTVKLNTNATATSGTLTLTGIPDGTYSLYVDPIPGFDSTSVGVISLSVSAGSGSANINYAINSSTLSGYVLLAQGSVMNNLQFVLTKEGISRNSPITSGNGFQFQNLKSGQYTLSVYDVSNQASQVLSVFVGNGTNAPIFIDLSQAVFYNLSGTVFTNAAPPYQNLNSIVLNSTPTTLYASTGSFTMPVLRVEAYLIKPDNTVDDLPTISTRLWDPAKIKFGVVNSQTGAYQIDGLKAGARYKIRLNPDFNNDGVFDVPLAEVVTTLSGNKAGQDFTITDGGSILGTVTASAADNAYPLTISLMDTDLKVVIRTQNISLVGAEASFSFPNLRVGRYLVQVVDAASPIKYAAKPVFVSLDNAADIKNVAINLFRGAVVRGKVSDKFGQIVNSTNVDGLLPPGTKIKLTSVGHITEATGPNAEGVFSANILPDTDYTLELKPPVSSDLTQAHGQGFLPVTVRVKASAGQYYDWGVLALTEGTNLAGLVLDDQSLPLSNIPVLAYQSLARNLTPLKVLTNDTGKFIFESLDSRVRFYDIVVNPQGNIDSQSRYAEQTKTMIDLTKLNNQTSTTTLATLSGQIRGVVIPAADDTLTAAYGENEGLSGASLLFTRRGTQKVLEFLTESTGTFQVALTAGRYDLEILAKNYKPLLLSNLSVTDTVINLGNIQLVRGVNLSGTLRNADGSLPLKEQVDKLLAIDSAKNIYRANLLQETVTQSIDRYVFNGLTAGTHTIVAVDILGRLRVLQENFAVPNQDSVLNLAFSVAEPQLVASFIQKLPDGVEAIFGCNQAFRNNPDDLDGNGTADDDEFANFVEILQGNGSIEFNSVSADRHKAAYTYVQNNDAGVAALELRGTFTTSEIDPKTGTYFVVQGTFTHPFGLQAQQSDLVTNLGGEFVLPGGSALSLPSNWSHANNLDGYLINFQAADTLNNLEAAQEAVRGAGAMAMAARLGRKAYPAHMYSAIKALAAAPEVNVFSSFYDIFLPANVSHIFRNKPTLTLTYDEGADPDLINVYYFNEAQGVYTIENVDRRIDTQNRTISVSIGHASVFTVLSSSIPIIRGDSYAGEMTVFNFPNPFNLNSKVVHLQNFTSGTADQTIEGTMIKVSVPSDASGALEIQIFDVAGEKVRTLSGEALAGGAHTYVEWDGRNDHGTKVASGVYIGRVTIGSAHEKFFKMAVIK